jgi:hypothetical protein
MEQNLAFTLPTQVVGLSPHCRQKRIRILRPSGLEESDRMQARQSQIFFSF